MTRGKYAYLYFHYFWRVRYAPGASLPTHNHHKARFSAMSQRCSFPSPQPQHPTLAGAQSLRRCRHGEWVSGQWLSRIHPWTIRLLPDEEWLHALRTKEVQHHSCSSAAPEMQAAGGSSCPCLDAAVVWRLPMGMARSLRGTTWEPASPLPPPVVCLSNREVLACFRDAEKPLLTCRKW